MRTSLFLRGFQTHGIVLVTSLFELLLEVGEMEDGGRVSLDRAYFS